MGVLQVQLDRPPAIANGLEGFYTSGSEVSGNVTYRFETQEKVNKISVAFTGECTWDTGNGANHRYIFQRRRVLFRGPFDLQPQTMNLPVRLRFPTEPVFDTDDNHDQRVTTMPPNENFIRLGGNERCDAVGALPPTIIRHGPHNVTVYNVYKLQVKVECGFRKSQSRDFPLHFISTSQPLTDDQSQVRNQALTNGDWSSDHLLEEKYTFGQKMKHAFSSHPPEMPRVAFSSYLHSSSSFAWNQSAPLMLSINLARPRAIDPPAPSLLLDTLEVELLSELVTDDNSQSTFSIGIQKFTGADVLLPLDGTPVLVAENFTLANFNFTSGQSGPLAVPCDFETSVITLSHKLKVAAKIRHLESGHVFDISGKFPIKILGPVCHEAAQRAEESGSTAVSGTAVSPPSYDGHLPPYEATRGTRSSP